MSKSVTHDQMIQLRNEICYALEIKKKCERGKKGEIYVLGSFMLRRLPTPRIVEVLFNCEREKNVEPSLIVVECVTGISAQK